MSRLSYWEYPGCADSVAPINLLLQLALLHLYLWLFLGEKLIVAFDGTTLAGVMLGLVLVPLLLALLVQKVAETRLHGDTWLDWFGW